MKDSKLISLLRKLSDGEFRDFEKFTASPFFSKGRDLTPFFKIIKNFYPDFDNDDLNNEFVFCKLFPDKKYDKVKSANMIKTLSSQLFLLCKDFLIQLDLMEDENRKQYYLLNQLRKKKLYNEYEKDLGNLNNEGKDVFKGTVRDFSEKYFLETIKRDYFLDRDEFEKCYEANLKSGEFSLLAGLIYAFRHQDEKNIAAAYNLTVRDNLMDLVLDNLDAEKLSESAKINKHELYPYIEIYYMLYRMNKFTNEEDYFKLKELLKQRSHLFGQYENYILWNMMMSFCNVKGMPYREHFNIYKYVLENGIYKKSSNEDFHVVMFRNIVTTALQVRAIDWFEDFINKYSSELHEDHRNDMRNYSLSVLNFMKGNYLKALELIQTIRFELIFYKIDIRQLQLKIYYKLEYYEQLYSLIDSTLHFLSKNLEIRNEHKISLKNFTKYLKELVKFKTNPGQHKGEFDFLRKKILAEKYFGAKEWFIEEINILVKK